MSEGIPEKGTDSSYYDPECDYERGYLDGTQPHPMFLDVRIEETEHGVGFNVPKRIIDTPHNGKWIFDIFGGRRWFKERDDYGNIRFTQSGISIWVPHLYPFEETDEHGLPRIPDRERCAVQIRLQPFNTRDGTFTEVGVSTPNALLTGQESALSFNYESIRFFDEFTQTGKPLISELVTWHQTEPDPWYLRQPSGFKGSAFGEMYIPIDELRRGVDAEISFPCFKP